MAADIVRTPRRLTFPGADLLPALRPATGSRDRDRAAKRYLVQLSDVVFCLINWDIHGECDRSQRSVERLRRAKPLREIKTVKNTGARAGVRSLLGEQANQPKSSVR
jgi:hypothetical protein